MSIKKDFDKLTDSLMQFSSLGIRPGLERTSRLLSVLGSPEKRFRAIHVLGTNGKGSTAATMEAILKHAGLKTALYTSPHLVSLQERLRVDGAYLSLGRWSDAFETLKAAVEEDEILSACRPTFFENLTAMAFSMIADSDVEIALIEAGMGGRYDATSVCDPIATVITPIGMDHMEYLGSTIEAIASEKFAAVKDGVPAFYAADDAALIDQFLETCNRAGAPPFLLDRIARPVEICCAPDGTTFSIPDMPRLYTPLVGVHQAENAVRAIVVLETLFSRDVFPHHMTIDAPALRDGLRETNWPGRFERFQPGDGLPDIVIDGAHNAHGMHALVETFSAMDKADLGAVVFAVMKDKDVAPVLEQLKRLDLPLYCTEAPNPRAMACAKLAEIARSMGIQTAGFWEDPFDALHAARTAVNPHSIVLCCGSLFLAGCVRERYAR